MIVDFRKKIHKSYESKRRGSNPITLKFVRKSLKNQKVRKYESIKTFKALETFAIYIFNTVEPED